MILDELGLEPGQIAAVDSILFMRDPFPVVSPSHLTTSLSDRNTRVIVFVRNLTIAPDETASVVTVNLIDSSNQSYDIPAEVVRVVPNFDFVQVVFRLPDRLAGGTCRLTIKARDRTSNSGTIRIQP